MCELTLEDVAIWNGVYKPAGSESIEARSNTRYAVREAARQGGREDQRDCQDDLTDYMERIKGGIARRYTIGVMISVDVHADGGHPFAVY